MMIAYSRIIPRIFRRTIDDDVESPTYTIAETLRAEGYEIANRIGIRQGKPNRKVIGILKPKEPVRRSNWGYSWTEKQRSLHFGNIWFDNEKKGAIPNERWVAEGYGRETYDELTTLVKNLAAERGVEIEIRLLTERAKTEMYLGG
ncbi:hypothetical protein CMO88_00880 [Candidatus Woesearchaeota archaeon]|jgi:hypothetical protein|nr:hypothetical protein [Candidatus Woesearchaeota archaeon]|tara:strand:+ start:18495 stop:18932 length:438 start_codon:yes stop_codon:yes gene_type:complete